MSLESQLHEAVEGDLEWTQELIDQGADVNACGAYGNTALMHAVAVIERDPAIVQLLIVSGADVNATTPEGYVALHMALDVNFEANEPECVRGVLKALVDAGADLEAKHHYGWTPLVCAVLEGSDLEVEILLECGSDPFVTGFKCFNFCPKGSTLLHAAAVEPAKLTALIKAGLDLNATTDEGATALDIAAGMVASHEECLSTESSEVLDESFGGELLPGMLEATFAGIPQLASEDVKDLLKKIEEAALESLPTNRELYKTVRNNARECVEILERALSTNGN